MRTKNSAPSIDPRCSAHAKVRALYTPPTRRPDDIPRAGFESPFIPVAYDDYLLDSFENLEDSEDEWEKNYLSDSEEKCEITNDPVVILPPVQAPPLYDDLYDPEWSDETTVVPPFSSPLFDPENQFVNTDTGSSNMSEDEFEELLRVYRETVW